MNQSVPHPPEKRPLLEVLGPGLVTGAADDDPSGIGTYSQVGAQFGYGMAWTMLFGYPLLFAIQAICAQIGATTGRGIAANLARHYPPMLLRSVVVLLIVANVINLGADLGAMSAALALLLPGPVLLYTAAFGAVSVFLEIWLSYERYSSILKWATLSLLSYVGVLFVAHVPVGEALRGIFIPSFVFDSEHAMALVAVFGTTISPYLFFWQSAEEVEDLHVHPRRKDLVDAPEQGTAALHRIEVDTLVGMALSNIVALAIMITTAATLNGNGVVDIQTSTQAAEALRPIAGRFAFVVFTLGIVGTGLLAVPVLAGSAAYALGEARRWPIGFSRRMQEAKAFMPRWRLQPWWA